MQTTPTPPPPLSDAEQALQSWQIEYTKRSDGTIFVAGISTSGIKICRSCPTSALS